MAGNKPSGFLITSFILFGFCGYQYIAALELNTEHQTFWSALTVVSLVLFAGVFLITREP